MKYIIKLDYEQEFTANSENEAVLAFYQDVESEPQQDLASFINDNLTVIPVKERKKNAIKRLVEIMSDNKISLQDIVDEYDK